MSAELALPARLDLPAAAPLVAELLARRGEDLSLAATDVTHLGTPGLQVLLSAARTWRKDGRNLTISKPSEAMTEQLGIFGLALEDLSTSTQET